MYSLEVSHHKHDRVWKMSSISQHVLALTDWSLDKSLKGNTDRPRDTSADPCSWTLVLWQSGRPAAGISVLCAQVQTGGCPLLLFFMTISPVLPWCCWAPWHRSPSLSGVAEFQTGAESSRYCSHIPKCYRSPFPGHPAQRAQGSNFHLWWWKRVKMTDLWASTS